MLEEGLTFPSARECLLYPSHWWQHVGRRSVVNIERDHIPGMPRLNAARETLMKIYCSTFYAIKFQVITLT